MTIRVTSFQLTCQAAAYASGDLVGGKLDLSTACKGRGILKQIILIDQANQKISTDFVMFDSDPSGTTFTENAALDVADADMLKVQAWVNIPAAAFVTASDNAVAVVTNLNIILETSTLFGALITRGAPTYAATTDLYLSLFIDQV